MTGRLRLGVIGCGEVTQIMHLPALASLRDVIDVAALCDVSRRVVDGVGEAWRIDRRHVDARALLDAPDIGAVLIANPHVFHAETAMACMAAGKHVLIEKPICLTLAEADALIAQRDRAGVVAQVGFMRRYAPAFLQACAMVRAMPAVHLARIRDVIGRNALIVQAVAEMVRADDLPADAGAALRDRQTEAVRAAVGPCDAVLEGTYLRLLGLASHDVSAMREMLGPPQGILYAACRNAGRALSAAFDYGAFVCHMEIGVDEIPRMDSHIEVSGGTKLVRVEYDTPYIRHLPTRLVVEEAVPPGGVRRESSYPDRGDPFAAEWRAFAANVAARGTPKTSLEDARIDLVLFREIIGLMRAGGGCGQEVAR